VGILTDAFIKKQIKPPAAGQKSYRDGSVDGLTLRVSPRGTMTFNLVYWVNRRQRRLTIGRYGNLTLAQARATAIQALADVERGIDPAFEKKRKERAACSNGFASLVAEYIEKYAQKNTKSWKQTEAMLKREFVSAWQDQNVADIKRGHIDLVLDSIVERGAPSTARRAHADLRRFFNWAVTKEYIKQSPCTNLPAPSEHRDRDRVLTDQELKQVWAAAVSSGYQFGYIVQLLVLTGQRREEVSSMRWEDIDFDEKVWSLPKSMNKSARNHDVPLTESALAILRQVPATSSKYVFPAQGKSTRHFSGYSKSKKRLDQLCGVSEWTLHDLRRTAATGMAKNKVPPHVVEKVLNHKDGTFKGVAGIYNRFGYLDEMREALEAWEKHVLSLSLACSQREAPRDVMSSAIEEQIFELN
jgi:integrase